MESPFPPPPPEASVTEKRERRVSAELPRSLRHRAPILWLLLPLMSGLIVGRLFPQLPAAVPLGVAVMATGAAIALCGRPRLWPWLACLCVALTASGTAYYTLRRARLGEWDHLPRREVRVTLAVDRTYVPSPDGKRVSGLARIQTAEAHLRELEGQRVYYALKPESGGAAHLRSQEINVVGLLEPLPSHAPLNTFEGYLVNTGVNFRLTRGRVQSVSREASAYRRFCARAQQHLAGILSKGLTDRQRLAAVSRAMLLGLQQELSPEQNEWFMQSGTMHLFSISGLHIAVIAVALECVLALLRVPKVARFLASAVLMWLYVDITGSAPSAIRAYAMVMLLQTSYVLKLPVNPIATLAFAALATLLVNPMQLFNASFQMSYGIVGALLLLGLPLADFWTSRWQLFRMLPRATWRRWHRWIYKAHQGTLAALALGLSTGVASLVCGVVYFGLFTPGSLLANLLLIPLGSLTILGGFVSLICGLASLDGLTVLFNHASALLIWVSERTLAVFVDVPGVFWKAKFVTVSAGFVAFGLLVLSLCWGYHHRWELKKGGVWPPFAIVLIAVVFCVKFG